MAALPDNKNVCICRNVYTPKLFPPQEFRMRHALFLASSGKMLSLSSSGYEQRASTFTQRESLWGQIQHESMDQRERYNNTSRQRLALMLSKKTAPFQTLTCRKKVMGCWPMACASPMLALMTSAKGFFIPWRTQTRINKHERQTVRKVQPSVQTKSWRTRSDTNAENLPKTLIFHPVRSSIMMKK